MLASAIAATRSGFHVFPLNGKRPLTPHAHLDATQDITQIRAWWAKYPDASIGTHCARSGVLVIDIDPRNGGDSSFKRLCSELPRLPPTWAVRTKSSGTHYYFTLPDIDREYERFRGGFGKTYPGIDIKVNGYVVLPPSPGYTWTEQGTVARLPADWIGRVTTQHVTATNQHTVFPPASKALLSAVQKALADVTEGSYVASCFLVNDWALTIDEALPLLEAWDRGPNGHKGDPCRLRGKLEGAMSRAIGEHGAKRLQWTLNDAFGTRKWYETSYQANCAFDVKRKWWER